MFFSWFYPTKKKLKKDDFKTLVTSSACVGALEVCDYMVYLHEKEGLTDGDELIGEIHKMRLAAWQEYCNYSDNVKPINSVEEAMKVEIDMSKFVKNPKLKQQVMRT